MCYSVALETSQFVCVCFMRSFPKHILLFTVHSAETCINIKCTVKYKFLFSTLCYVNRGKYTCVVFAALREGNVQRTSFLRSVQYINADMGLIHYSVLSNQVSNLVSFVYYFV